MNKKQHDKIQRDWKRYMEWTRQITNENKGLTFIRTKTLADGDEMCDFQYYRTDRNIDMNGVTLK